MILDHLGHGVANAGCPNVGTKYFIGSWVRAKSTIRSATSSGLASKASHDKLFSVV